MVLHKKARDEKQNSLELSPTCEELNFLLCFARVLQVGAFKVKIRKKLYSALSSDTFGVLQKKVALLGSLVYFFTIENGTGRSVIIFIHFVTEIKQNGEECVRGRLLELLLHAEHEKGLLLTMARKC